MPCLSLKFTSPLSDSILSNRKEDRHHWQRSFRISSCCTTQQGNSSLGITSASFAWNLFSETPWSRENLGAVVLPGTRPYFRVACGSVRFFVVVCLLCCCFGFFQISEQITSFLYLTSKSCTGIENPFSSVNCNLLRVCALDAIIVIQPNYM